MNEDIQLLNKQALIYSKDLELIIEEMHRSIIGQDIVLEKIILALVADGHVLLEGMPGLAKTLMIKTLSDTIEASFKRLTFSLQILSEQGYTTRIHASSPQEKARYLLISSLPMK
jgi:MoxR-like ATPase